MPRTVLVGAWKAEAEVATRATMTAENFILTCGGVSKLMALVPAVSAGIFGRGCPPRAWGRPRGGARAVRCRGGRARTALKDAANPQVEVLVWWWWGSGENVSAMSEPGRPPGVLRCAARPGDARDAIDSATCSSAGASPTANEPTSCAASLDSAM